MTLDEIKAEDSIQKRKSLIRRYIGKKMDYYERQLAMSGDDTQCDDVDWIELASDMFDTLQMVDQNLFIS